MNVKQLAELAKELNEEDPIDWGKLQITEEYAYEMMASNVLEQFSSIPNDHHMAVALATITKLLVESFVLNVKLRSK